MSKSVTRRLTATGAAVAGAAVIALLLLTGGLGFHQSAAGAAEPVRVVVNMATAGDAAPNATLPAANTLGDVVPCAQLAVGATMDIDITVQAPGLPQGGAPPIPDGTLAGLGYDLIFNGAQVEIDAASHDFLITAGTPQGAVVDLSNVTFPDTSGDARFDAANLTGGGQTGNGVGVLSRITIKGLANGLSAITLANDNLPDNNANSYETTPGVTVVAGHVAVGTATCPVGPALTQGDVDCNGSVNAVDALKELRHVVDLSVTQEPGCPQIGSGNPMFGDVDCSNTVDAVDALKILRHVVALPVSQNPGCTPIGNLLSGG